MKPKGVTTQMKALDEYFLMVVFTLLLNRLHVFAIFMFNLVRENWQWKRVTTSLHYASSFVDAFANFIW